MKETLQDLDFSSPWGRDVFGMTKDKTEHGQPINDIDLAQQGFDVKIVNGQNNQYRLFSRIRHDNKNTVLVVAKGDGRLYSIKSHGKDSLVFPASLSSSWPQDINLIFLDLINPLPYDLLIFSKLRLMNIPIESIPNLIVQHYSNPVDETLLKFFQDFIPLVDELKKTTRFFLLGHSNSCELIARFYDLILDKKSIAGLIFCNPATNTYMQQQEKIKYFYCKIQQPILILQHQQDTSKKSSVVLSQRLFDDFVTMDSKYIKVLAGGSNQGLPEFSVGYHGFREIESQVCEEIKKFIGEI